MTTSDSPWPTCVPGPMRPGLDLPGRQALGQGELDLGRAVRGGASARRPRRRCRRSWCGRRAGPRRPATRTRRRTRPRSLTLLGDVRETRVGARTLAASLGHPAPRAAAAAAGRRHHGHATTHAAHAAHTPPCPSPRIEGQSSPAASQVSASSPPNSPRFCMPISFGLIRLREPAVEARLGLRVVRPLPLPEELLDVRDVRAARDVLDGLVVDGQHGRARRTACRRGR